MNTIGRLIDVSYGMDGKPRVLFEIEKDPELVPTGELDIQIKPYKKKRSLDANAYYWVLTNKIASVLRTSTAEVHLNQLIKYGVMDLDETGAARWVVMKDGVKVPDGLYLQPTSNLVRMPGKKNEFVGRVYIVYRGSHTYNTQEMSVLIDGTIQDAKDLGIDTITPAEKARMLAAWGKHEEEN